nr:uncharacterized protein LOC100939902 [Pongo abelii]
MRGRKHKTMESDFEQPGWRNQGAKRLRNLPKVCQDVDGSTNSQLDGEPDTSKQNSGRQHLESPEVTMGFWESQFLEPQSLHLQNRNNDYNGDSPACWVAPQEKCFRKSSVCSG